MTGGCNKSTLLPSYSSATSYGSSYLYDLGPRPIPSTGKVGSDVPRINDITHGGARPKTKSRSTSLAVRDEEGWTTVHR